MWRYGTERSCALEGQYITFEADFSLETTPYEKAICIVGVMGNFIEEETDVTVEQETSAPDSEERAGIYFAS